MGCGALHPMGLKIPGPGRVVRVRSPSPAISYMDSGLASAHRKAWLASGGLAAGLESRTDHGRARPRGLPARPLLLISSPKIGDRHATTAIAC